MTHEHLFIRAVPSHGPAVMVCECGELRADAEPTLERALQLARGARTRQELEVALDEARRAAEADARRVARFLDAAKPTPKNPA